MRLIELLVEASMSDLADFRNQFDQLTEAEVDWDLTTNTVYISFTLDSQPGTMCLRMRNQGTPEKTAKRFRSRVYAAAVSNLGGNKPNSWAHAQSSLKGKVRGHALRLLSDSKIFEIVRLRWQDLNIG
jgi:hypothetical protein